MHIKLEAFIIDVDIGSPSFVLHPFVNGGIMLTMSKQVLGFILCILSIVIVLFVVQGFWDIGTPLWFIGIILCFALFIIGFLLAKAKDNPNRKQRR